MTAPRSVAVVVDTMVESSLFKELGLTADDVQTTEQMVDVLAAHPALLQQRPIVVRAQQTHLGPAHEPPVSSEPAWSAKLQVDVSEKLAQ